MKILDLTRALAGPLSAMTLADLGADVIKVERPLSGDESRAWGPPFDERGESAYYLSVNRNKLSIALDLDSPSDLDTLRSLIAGADAVVDNFRVGTLERRGIDVLGILADHDRLLWCTLTGFGAGSDRPGYDFVIQAESGWMAITGSPDGEPMKVGVALADVVAGKDAAISILAALAGRTHPRPAADRWMLISLSGSAVAALVNVAQSALVSGRPAQRWGNAHANLVPYQLFHASDRPIVIAVGNDAQWRGCLRALDLDDLLNDPALATNSGRLAHRERVVRVIAERLAQGTADEWLQGLAQRGVPAGRVRSVSEALAEVEASPLTGLAPSVPGSVRLPPPRLDEHGTIVREYGWTAFRHVTPLGA